MRLINFKNPGVWLVLIAVMLVVYSLMRVVGEAL